MDRQEALKLANDHKAKAVIARTENRLWDAMREEAMYFHYNNFGINPPADGWVLQVHMLLGFTMIRLNLNPIEQKEIVVDIAKWSRESGNEDELTELLARYGA